MTYAFMVFFANKNWTLCAEGVDIDEAFSAARDIIRKNKLHSASIQSTGRAATPDDIAASESFLNGDAPKHKPDYHWIKIDETKHWIKTFLRKIGPDATITSIYVFDHNSTTNCCELTPSYALYRAGTSFNTKRDLSLTEAEEIEEEIRVAQVDEDEVTYMHCSDIDSNKRSQPVSQFVDCDSDTKIEEVQEYYQANPW